MSKIKALRQKKGMTQYDLAKELNISQGSLSSYETGRTNIDNDMLIRFAKYFGVSVDEILGIDSTKQRETREMSDTEYQLSGEIRNLSEQEMKEVLDFVRFKRTQRKC